MNYPSHMLNTIFFFCCLYRQSNEAQQTIAKLLQQLPRDKSAPAKLQLQKIRNLVQECMGYEEHPNVVEHATLYLFWLFLGQKVVSVAHTTRIKIIFGTIFNGILARVLECVKHVHELLDENELDDLKNWANKTKNGGAHANSWGSQICIKLGAPPQYDALRLQDLSPSSILNNEAQRTFSMHWNNEDEKHGYECI